MYPIAYVVAETEHASVLRQSLSILGPSVLHKDERLSVRLAVSHDNRIWDIIVAGKAPVCNDGAKVAHTFIQGAAKISPEVFFAIFFAISPNFEVKFYKFYKFCNTLLPFCNHVTVPNGISLSVIMTELLDSHLSRSVCRTKGAPYLSCRKLR